jgi:hypothetical protein
VAIGVGHPDRAGVAVLRRLHRQLARAEIRRQGFDIRRFERQMRQPLLLCRWKAAIENHALAMADVEDSAVGG